MSSSTTVDATTSIERVVGLPNCREAGRAPTLGSIVYYSALALRRGSKVADTPHIPESKQQGGDSGRRSQDIG